MEIAAAKRIPGNATAMTTATPIFRAIMLECERRRVALGFPMEKFSEYAGLPERYYPKALHADLPSGRQGQWSTLQTIIDALFPSGFDVEIRARPGAPGDYESLKAKLLQLRATKDPRSQRELMRELGRKGLVAMLAKRGEQALRKQRRKAGRARARTLSRERRIEIAKAGALKRWSTPQITEVKK